MGPELLIASLWCVALIYWLWSKRPTLGDTVGSFRHELRVLEHAMPAPVVAPANRRRPGAPPFAGPAPKDVFGDPVSVAAAARNHKREELRRRRRDVIEVLFAMVLLSLLVALLTHSALAFGLQAVVDIVLFVYVLVLIRTTSVQRSGGRASVGAKAGSSVPTAALSTQISTASYVPANGHTNGQANGHTNGQANGHTNGHTNGGWEQPSYGDFESYASLAVSRAN